MDNLFRTSGACQTPPKPLNRKPVTGDDGDSSESNRRCGMIVFRGLAFSILLGAMGASPALAQSCTRQGVDVSCDDGRRGLLSGDAIIWADGSRSSLTSPHP